MDHPRRFPDALVGAWHRRSVQFGDAPPGEPARVLWLQGAPLFADVRVPRAAATGPFATLEAFAGTTTWHAASHELSWEHDVDLTATFAGVDRAEVHFDGPDTMVETGTLLLDGAPTRYREVWARVASGIASTERWADGAGTGVRVEIDRLSLTVAAEPGGVVRAVLVVDGCSVVSIGPEGVDLDDDAFDSLVSAQGASR
jgi:hypothetical protein